VVEEKRRRAFPGLGGSFGFVGKKKKGGRGREAAMSSEREREVDSTCVREKLLTAREGKREENRGTSPKLRQTKKKRRKGGDPADTTQCRRGRCG